MNRVFVDTNVLFPFSVMDLLLALSEGSVHTVIWTDVLLDEWERVIVRQHQRSVATAASVTAAIREFFADSKIEYAAYEHLIVDMPGNDLDDRHHMAAAIAGQATMLITENLKDFPAELLAGRELRIIPPTPTCANYYKIYQTRSRTRLCASPARNETRRGLPPKCWTPSPQPESQRSSAKCATSSESV